MTSEISRLALMMDDFRYSRIAAHKLIFVKLILKFLPRRAVGVTRKIQIGGRAAKTNGPPRYRARARAASALPEIVVGSEADALL
ncbi:hypothetical protein EVAR_63351_1 [Eumeta japonica]|uniref:Uncharacterized protein n=1 Tax=Eumeta variegata TaxID=151549 RepID=A0A4C2A9K8_EUMVA|nr:hypothetical protein EVAR_63351_1 [Eumeta japonica]